MRLHVYSDPNLASEFAANECAEYLRAHRSAKLGLATGGTVIPLYDHLIRAYNDGYVSFEKIRTFNLDEYVGLPQGSPQSYRYFMNEHLFDHIDIHKTNTFFPDVYSHDHTLAAQDYELRLQAYKGVNLQLLGIGRNGHIGFNEPGTSFSSLTHLSELSYATRMDNQRYFEQSTDVPAQAITMGLSTIMRAQRIMLLAFGKAKAQAVNAMVTGVMDESCPASILQSHDNVDIILDEEAACYLPQRCVSFAQA